MEQTAVDWFYDKVIQKQYKDIDDSLEDLFEQAKEMFEKQVRDAWNDGVDENTGGGDSEAYYDKTFNE